MISLRNRLLASYLFLLVFTIGGIILALLVTTASQPAPPETTYQRLKPRAEQLTLDKLLLYVLDINRSLPQQSLTLQENVPLPEGISTEQPSIFQTLQPTPDSNTPPDTQPISQMEVAYESYAQDNHVRMLRLVPETQVNNIIQARVVYDTNRTLEVDTRLRLRLDEWEDPIRVNPIRSDSEFKVDSSNLVYGSFSEDGRQWLFSANLVATQDDNFDIYMAADIRPTTSLQRVLADFGTALVTPLLQAAIFGSLIAIALSILISRTIAYPLQAASEAATAVAKGDLSVSVPVTGPEEVRSVAVAFNHMTAEVMATQQAQRDLLANVSHDLKTPLASIQGYAQAIMDGVSRDPEQSAEIIYDEASRLNRMVVQLTDLARLQSGQLSMHMQDIDLQELVKMVANQVQVVAQEKGVLLTTWAYSVPPISGDGDRLVQVLTNLLSNAIKYTASDGEVSVRTQAVFNGVEIEVRDSGIGISKEELPRIFERFYQVDKARGPSRGTGLGLAITYEIVQAHGGSISVQSVEGEGTVFKVWFPAHVEAPALPEPAL